MNSQLLSVAAFARATVALVAVVAVAGLFVDVTSPMLVTPWGSAGVRLYKGYVALELRTPATPAAPVTQGGDSVASRSWGRVVEFLRGGRYQNSTRYQYRSFGVGFLTWIALLLVIVAASRKRENVGHARGFPIKNRERSGTN